MPGRRPIRSTLSRGKESVNHSLPSADRNTHVKIVVVALVGATLVVLAGIAAHLSGDRELARLQAHGPVLKANKPVSLTAQGAVIR